MKCPTEGCQWAVGHKGDCLITLSGPHAGPDIVNHPAHYTSHPSGVECIDITEHLNFCLGCAVKYLWRAGLKSPDPINDLEKARWYIDREIARLRKAKEKAPK